MNFKKLLLESHFDDAKKMYNALFNFQSKIKNIRDIKLSKYDSNLTFKRQYVAASVNSGVVDFVVVFKLQGEKLQQYIEKFRGYTFRSYKLNGRGGSKVNEEVKKYIREVISNEMEKIIPSELKKEMTIKIDGYYEDIRMPPKTAGYITAAFIYDFKTIDMDLKKCIKSNISEYDIKDVLKDFDDIDYSELQKLGNYENLLKKAKTANFPPVIRGGASFLQNVELNASEIKRNRNKSEENYETFVEYASDFDIEDFIEYVGGEHNWLFNRVDLNKCKDYMISGKKRNYNSMTLKKLFGVFSYYIEALNNQKNNAYKENIVKILNEVLNIFKMKHKIEFSKIAREI